MGYQHKPFETELFDAKQLWKLTAPLRAYFSPKFYGLEKLDPNKPTLLVGNHTIYGVIDVPLFLAQIYRERGVLVRALADHQHYDIPLWRDVLDRTGGVEGTRENCSALMQRGEHVLVFPGGAREVSKRKGEQYQLTWKRRTGFCSMAIQHGYNILPFAVVGPDDMYDIVLDAEDILQSPVGKLLKKAGLLEKKGLLRGGDIIMPLTRGLGLTALPRPERFYFAIGDEIEVSPYQGKENDQDALFELRDEVAFSIQDIIGELLTIRENDIDKGLFRKLLTSL
ncbi:MAG: acyltransferase [Pseudomonadales bacterium]|jgi:1-acyl-sn-glycerol-3-phosphate acyltransferase|uniref:lysophospholipid acyltransferase family protein n=1 Tax=unclassified Ketobacter TaxID=2639109 RepID=UPI000C5D8CA5|nr:MULTISPECIES: lysophospholipid acyltransferase family protein [unclassified Ketobacter]MAQ25813.1 acyltransferase [Pseudomonadales bacterium]MEC8810966.1 lysophospholipid acyltransferase family protein [Pseudomonadota bacterium]TNC89010.1 MAG: acyltransferase [Alcanivorax sp.]HAU14730.1 acyltransferase [Gammaproteobacteria bacterium]MBI28084.1 acyltransferase [Pseudomonadales bacterium]|tara:strand:- start:10533 stop:11378 length:846 start_codon:yes stop_codon:yes gene_type:complete